MGGGVGAGGHVLLMVRCSAVLGGGDLVGLGTGVSDIDCETCWLEVKLEVAAAPEVVQLCSQPGSAQHSRHVNRSCSF